MHAVPRVTRALPHLAGTLLLAAALSAFGAGQAPSDPPAPRDANPVRASAAYARMPSIAPIGVRVDRYADIPDSAKGPAVDPVKGYRLQELGRGLYMVTDGTYQSMFMTYEGGVVVVDAPPSYVSHIPAAIASVTDQPITHLVYSHFHVDHIGGATELGVSPTIIAHVETDRLLAEANDPRRPRPGITFDRTYRLALGSQVLELSYGHEAHAPGNIFIHAPQQRTLMVVDVVFPGWMPWRRFAVARDVRAYFAQVEQIAEWDFDTLVGGHVARTGTRADVQLQVQFMDDLKSAAQAALAGTTPGEGLHPDDRANPWAVFDHYIDRVAIDCVNRLIPTWGSRLAAFDVYIWDQCYAMEQSLRID